MKISVKFPKGIPFFELKNQQIANMLNDFADTSVTHIKAETNKDFNNQLREQNKYKHNHNY